MKTHTTSIRLSVEMSDKLNQASSVLHRGKNWIITQAISRYLSQIKSLTLAEEAKRQSLLASRSLSDDIWEDNSDFEDWK